MRRIFSDKERNELIESVLGGRASVVEAAAKIGVAASTGYAWVKDARKRSVSPSPSFVQVVRARAPDVEDGICVRVAGAEVCVRRGFDADVLRAVVAALRKEQSS